MPPIYEPAVLVIAVAISILFIASVPVVCAYGWSNFLDLLKEGLAMAWRD